MPGDEGQHCCVLVCRSSEPSSKGQLLFFKIVFTDKLLPSPPPSHTHTHLLPPFPPSQLVSSTRNTELLSSRDSHCPSSGWPSTLPLTERASAGAGSTDRQASMLTSCYGQFVHSPSIQPRLSYFIYIYFLIHFINPFREICLRYSA